jgi:hypothetical protein
MSTSLPEDRTCRVAFTAYDVQVSGGAGQPSRFCYYPALALCTDGIVIGRKPREVPGVGLAAQGVEVVVGVPQARDFVDSIQDSLLFAETKLRNLALRRAMKRYGDYITSQQILNALGSKAQFVPIAHVTKVTLTPLVGLGGKHASMLMEFDAPEIGHYPFRAPRETVGYLEDELRGLFGGRLIVKPRALMLHPESR